MGSFLLLKSFLNRWSLFSLFLTLLSLIIQFAVPSFLPFSLPVFLLSALLSLLFWNLLGAIVELLPRGISFFMKGLLALLLPLVLAVGIGVYMEFNLFLDHNLLSFVFEDPEYLVNVFQVFFSKGYRIAGYLLVSVLLFLFFAGKAPYRQRKYTRVAVLAVVVTVGQNQFGRHGHSNFTGLDTCYLFAYKEYERKKSETSSLKRLKPSGERITPNRGNATDYNIVLVVQESMSVEPLSFYGYENEYTPFLQSWTEREKENFILFQDALSVSGCTDISMPTLYTGAAPEEGYKPLMSLPFMWDYAKANSYETALISSQRYTWSNLRFFVKNKHLDLLYTAEDSGLEVVNDLGVDDIAISEWAQERIVTRQQNTPLFLIYNTNALHKPYQDKSALLTIPKHISERYGKALYIIDKSIENIYKAFEERGELDKTIFIFTSDHGDYAVKRQQRLGSFLKETLQIPLFIRLPKGWIEENPAKYEMLKNNKDKRVCNLDITPTVIDLLEAKEANSELLAQLKGISLCDSIDNSRVLIRLSTNETRVWSNEGLGLYKDSLSYIVDNQNREQLYNLNQDPDQFYNIIGNHPELFEEHFREIIESNSELTRIYTNYAN